MKRRAMALCLAMLLLFAALPLSANETQVRFLVDGEAFSSLAAGEVSLPQGPVLQDGRTFIGWKTTKDGETLLLPSGALVTAEAGAVFEAVILSAQTLERVTVRAEEENVGLRFVSQIAKSEYDFLCSVLGEEEISFGTLISMESYAMRLGPTLHKEGLEDAGYSYIDVPASHFYKISETHNTWAGAVHSLNEENASRRYAGIGYIKLTYSNGEEKTVYLKAPKTFDNGKVRYYNFTTGSAFHVLLDAYNDRNLIYEHPIRETETSMPTNSPYPMQTLMAIKAYLNGTVSVKITSDGKYYVEERGLYRSPYKVAFNMSNDIITVTAKDGGEIDGLFAIVLCGSYFNFDSIRSKTDTVCEFRTSAQSPDY